ncbi:MAG: TIGR04086 family membrane protein [Clostridia bacterium]
MKKITVKFAKTDLLDILKGIGISVIFSAVLIMIFALILKLTDVPNGVIVGVNTAIKVLSLLVACLISFKSGQNYLLKGIIVGFIYFLLTYLLTSISTKVFALNLCHLYDFLLCVVVGAVSASIKSIITK